VSFCSSRCVSCTIPTTSLPNVPSESFRSSVFHSSGTFPVLMSAFTANYATSGSPENAMSTILPLCVISPESSNFFSSAGIVSQASLTARMLPRQNRFRTEHLALQRESPKTLKTQPVVDLELCPVISNVVPRLQDEYFEADKWTTTATLS